MVVRTYLNSTLYVYYSSLVLKLRRNLMGCRVQCWAMASRTPDILVQPCLSHTSLLARCLFLPAATGQTHQRILSFPVTVHREQSVKREKTNKIQQSDVYYQLLSQHVPGIIMPFFRRTKIMLLHMVYCAGSVGCGW